MSTHTETCPVCGATATDQATVACATCGFTEAYYVLFGGEEAYTIWCNAVAHHKQQYAARLYAESRDKGAELQVTGDRLCFVNRSACEAVLARFDGGKPSVIPNVMQMSLSGLHCAWVNADGTVGSAGDNESGQRRLEDLTDVRYVAAAHGCTYAVKADGTVIDRGNSPFAGKLEHWRDIAAVSANPFQIVGLRTNGTVVHLETHHSPLKDYAAAMDGWKDVKAIALGEQYVLALHTDGTVSYAGARDERAAAADWTDVVAIAADNQYAIGLTKDGEVLLAGKESAFVDFDRKTAKQWKNVVFIAAGRSVIAGLTENGELKVVGNLFRTDSFDSAFIEAVYASLQAKEQS